MEYSNFEKNNKIYSGTEKKIGVTINSDDYIIKFQKQTRFGLRNNHISEYIGCKIFESLKINVQEAVLGTFEGEPVVVVKDFIGPNQNFVSFNDVGESSIEEDREKFTYSYEDITEILLCNNKLDNPEDTIEMFWTIYIVDALLGNFDRHGGNWGFVKKNGIYTLAPVFDNGSCLYPNLTDLDEMRNIIDSNEETDKRIYKFPTSQIHVNNRKSSYFDVISSMEYEECNKALVRVCQLIDILRINVIIGNTKFISDIQKTFYKHMIYNRFEKIIRYSYKRLGMKK